MKNKVLIFTATFNEAENIKSFLDSIYNQNINADILVVDDNSPDNTWGIVKKYAEEKKNLHLIIRNSKEGLDTAHKAAYEFSVANNYDFLITLDADLTHDTNQINEFITEIENNDFVIGSRYMKGGKTDIKGFRLFLSYLGNKFIKFMFNINCNEFTSSFRAFNLIRLKKFDLKIITSKGYSFFMETVYQINKNNFKIKQIPIYARQRDKGKSKIARIELLRTLVNVFRLKFRKKN